MKTFVYIDAFNLYFGAVKGTPFKWLDVSKLCSILLPKHDIIRIKYFTAKINPRPHDPDQPTRQEIYFRALRTLPNIEIYFGHFLTHDRWMPMANDSNDPRPNVAVMKTGQPRPDVNFRVNLVADPRNMNPSIRVVKTEEKGSDVNIATHLLHDAYNRQFDAAVVMSGDSDLLSPVKIVMEELKKPVGVINPQRKPCRVLEKQATFYKHIRPQTLEASQFADTLKDTHGEFSKPSRWKTTDSVVYSKDRKEDS